MRQTQRIYPARLVERANEILTTFPSGLGAGTNTIIVRDFFYSGGTTTNTVCGLGLIVLSPLDVERGNIVNEPGMINYAAEVLRRTAVMGFDPDYVKGFDRGFADENSAWTEPAYPTNSLESIVYGLGKQDGERCYTHANKKKGCATFLTLEKYAKR